MKYSVIIPVYNKNETILDAVASIMAQTSKDFEILIIDDGSTIPVSCVLGQYKNDERVKVIRKKNGGVSSARNAGIKEAKGKYLCFLDADDLWLPNHLSELDRLIKKYGEVAMLVTSHIEHLPNGTEKHCGNIMPDKEHDFKTSNLFKLLTQYSGGIIHTNSVCVNNTVCVNEKILFAEGAVRGEDTDVWFRVALRHDIVFTKEETTIYRREFSTATRDTSFIYSWVFAERLPDIVSDYTIRDDVKKACIKFLDRYWMTCVRESRLDGNKSGAKQYLKKISEHTTKRYFVTWMFAYLPDSLFKKAYALIMRR